MASSKPYHLGLVLSITCLLQVLLAAANPPPPPPPCEKSDKELRFMFSQWMSTYTKHYSCPQEQEKRYQVWKGNTNFIGAFRSQTELSSAVGAFAPQTVTESAVGMNRFGDLTTGEFVQQFTGFNATGAPEFQFYKGGVFRGPCNAGRVNHAVTVVGYCENIGGDKYWIAKNSWGSDWGDQGYVYLAKDVLSPQGTCGLATSPFYPTV
uniref:Cathepsin propeptide inhibitor domain-containing protein n=1 Tax=Oryza brachyantha TaxID=4533 RepID=J3KZN1_ORYBR